VVGQVLAVTCGGVSVPVTKTDIGFAFTAQSGTSYRLMPSIMA
jgi:hypothetical protein